MMTQEKELVALVVISSLLLIWGVHGGAITIEQASAVLRTVVMMCLAWLFLESVQ